MSGYSKPGHVCYDMEIRGRHHGICSDCGIGHMECCEHCTWIKA